MSHARRMLLVLLPLGLSACSGSAKIDARLAPDAALSGKRTYVLLAAPEGAGERTPAIIEFLEKRVRPEIARALNAKGYAETQADAQLTVVVHASQTGEVNANRWGYNTVGWTSWGPWYASSVAVYSYQADYKKGIVVCDVADTATHALLYRSYVEGFVGLHGDPDQERIREVVGQMLAKLPKAS